MWWWPWWRSFAPAYERRRRNGRIHSRFLDSDARTLHNNGAGKTRTETDFISIFLSFYFFDPLVLLRCMPSVFMNASSILLPKINHSKTATLAMVQTFPFFFPRLTERGDGRGTRAGMAFAKVYCSAGSCNRKTNKKSSISIIQKMFNSFPKRKERCSSEQHIMQGSCSLRASFARMPSHREKTRRIFWPW